MTSPSPTDILGQINAARDQTYQNIATAQGILNQANAAASAAAQDRAAIQAIAQQTVSVDTSVGTRVFAGDAMIYGDTGWRNIGANGTTSWDFSGHGRYGIAIRRVNDQVSVWVAGKFDTTGGNTTLFSIPAGFINTSPFLGRSYASVGVAKVNSTLYTIGSYANGIDYYFGGAPSGLTGSIIQEFTWQTGDRWPTSLPGTAV